MICMNNYYERNYTNHATIKKQIKKYKEQGKNE